MFRFLHPWVGCLILITFELPVTSAKEIWKDLNAPRDWQPLHEASAIAEASPGFSLASTGADPYILSGTMTFSAQKFAVLEIEMSASAGSQSQVFWTTDTSLEISEAKSIRFQLNPDQQFHTYTLALLNQPQWKGNITRLRFDPTDAKANLIIRSFRVVDRVGPGIELVSFNPQKPFALPGEEFALSARLRNVGDVTGTAQLSVKMPQSVTFAKEENLKREIQIPPGGEQEVHWNFQSKQEGVVEVFCEWLPVGFTSAASPNDRTLNTVIQITDIKNPKETLLLEDEQSGVSFLRAEMGYGPIRFFVKKNNELRDVAWMARLGIAHVLQDDGSVLVWPIFSGTVEHRGSGNMLFRRSWDDKDGRKWNFELDVRKIAAPAGAYSFIYRLSCEGGKLLHFSGPELFVGERGFQTQKELAILPGVEYLDRDAVSSSDAVARPPVRDQTMPHPYKLTIPWMSMTWDGMLVALLWPQNSPWSRTEKGLSPKFSVPNRLYGQQNHLFGLFVPSVPNFTRENQEIAFRPYVLQPGETLQIECTVYLSRSANPVDALSAWSAIYNRNSIPEPVPAPRNYQEEITLSRQAYLKSCWDESKKGWGHCVGWPAISSGGMLALLALDEYLSPTPQDKETLRARIELVKKNILDTQGPAGLGEPAGCHVMTLEPAFFWGVTESKLPAWRQQAQNMAQTQNQDGSWGFQPSKDDQKTLGKPGEVVSGTISPNTQFLLRLARITGDPIAAAAGLKALEALNKQTVPRGAQGWECPIAAADILVSAHGTRANVDAFQMTGDPKYFERAVYWARSGLVFHYLWNLDDRPLQRYATIPIFGTTFFTHSWRGVPVQWCGLVYAYALLELAAIDNSFPWRTVARGIVNSGMMQQIKEGERIGTLPDSYGDYFVTPRGPFINPENIMTNLHALEGNSLDIRTVFVGKPGAAVPRISANADIANMQSTDKSLAFTLISKPGRMTEALVAPLPQSATAVILNGTEPLPNVNSLYGKDLGWRYLPDCKALLIHVTHKTEKADILIKN